MITSGGGQPTNGSGIVTSGSGSHTSGDAPTAAVVPAQPPYGERVGRRCLIWFLALAVAWFVPLHAAGWPFHLLSWVQRVEEHNKLQDAFLAVVAMVVLSGTDLFEIVAPRRGITIRGPSQVYGVVVLVVYFLFILFGMAEFDSLETVVANHQDTTSYWFSMAGLLFLGLVSEFVIAGET